MDEDLVVQCQIVAGKVANLEVGLKSHDDERWFFVREESNVIPVTHESKKIQT